MATVSVQIQFLLHITNQSQTQHHRLIYSSVFHIYPKYVTEISTEIHVLRVQIIFLSWSLSITDDLLPFQIEQLQGNNSDKTNKMTVCPGKTQINLGQSDQTRISLGICPVWSESSLSAWRKLGSLATHYAHSEDSDQTVLTWAFAGRTVTLLVLSWGSSYSI